MAKLPTVTIGIPALNEEANIGYLLMDIYKQDCSGFVVEQVIILSDGSTDNTVNLVNKLKKPNTIIMDNKVSRGVADGQNQILSRATSDVLVLLNADIRLPKTDFMEQLIAPILEHRADLTSPLMMEMQPRSFIEAVLAQSMKLKNILFANWKGGNNGYFCHGSVRAFSRRFYQDLHFSQSEGEDMYSYLTCINLGYKFKYVTGGFGAYRLPNNIHDHFKQSVRYYKYQNKFAQELDKELVSHELKIPRQVYVKAAVKALPTVLKAPVLTLSYLAIVSYMKARALFTVGANLWEASTTKDLYA